jgi:hypothetical protein
MPLNLKQVGYQLAIVGKKQVSTGEKLTTYSGKTKAVGTTIQKDKKISKSMKSIEDGIVAVRGVLSFISGLVKGIANFLRTIWLPNIEPNIKNISIGKPFNIHLGKFVVGISIDKKFVFEGTADNLDKLAANIETARSSLQTIAENLKSIREQLPTIAENILSGSTDMKDAGQDMVDAGNAMAEAGTLLQAL